MNKLASRLSAVKPSATLAVSQRAAELRAEGADVISMSAGEPDFDTPPHIISAAKQALDDGMTRYTPVAGIPALRKAVAGENLSVRGIESGAENVIVSVGAKHTLYEFFQAVINPGDEVIIPAPYWVSYPDQVLLAGGVPVIADTRAQDGFVLSADGFKKLLTEKTKVLILNTPSNPTGGVYSEQEVRELTSAAVDAGVYVLSDEIYRDLIYGDAIHTSPLSVVAEDKRDLVFVVDGVSKTYAMTGWRIGWGIGDPDLIKGMTKIQSQSTSNPAAMAQAAALAAVEGTKEFLPDWQSEYATRREALCSGLAEMHGVNCLVPKGAFYVLPSVQGIIERMGGDATDVTVATYLLEEALVAVVPGTAFGAAGHIRLSYATSLHAIQEALSRIKSALSSI